MPDNTPKNIYSNSQLSTGTQGDDGGPRNRQAFLDLIESGFRVIPADGETKRPLLGKNWQDHWTTDPQVVESWLRRWPNCMPGVVCGDQGDDWALFVVDVDLKGEAEFRATFGDPATFCRCVVRTQSGGWHLYFAILPELVEALGQPDLFKGVNTRGHHGYVVGPGAITEAGTFYEGSGFTISDIEPLPAAIMARLEGLKGLVEPDPAPPAALDPETAAGGVLEPAEATIRSGLAVDGKSTKLPHLSGFEPPRRLWTPSPAQITVFERLAATPAVVGQRSEKFADCVWYGKRVGIEQHVVVATLRRFPGGPAAKYRPGKDGSTRDRIAEEVERVWNKPEAPAAGSFEPHGERAHAKLGEASVSRETPGGTKGGPAGANHEQASTGAAAGKPGIAGSDQPAVPATPKLDPIDWSLVEAGRALKVPPPPVDWIVNHSFEAASVGAVVTIGAFGKTQLFLELAIRRAFFGDPVEQLNRPIFGGNVVKGGSTIIVTAEDTEADLARRLHALNWTDAKTATAGTDPEGRHEYVRRHDPDDERWRLVRPLSTRRFMRSRGKPASTLLVRSGKNGAELTDLGRELVEELIEEAIRDRAGVIGFDPLSRFFGGNSNSAEDVALFLALMETIADETGALVLYSHHMTKDAGKVSAEGRGTMSREQARFGSRGSGNLTEGVRCVWSGWPMALADIRAEVEAGGSGLAETLIQLGHSVNSTSGKVIIDPDDFGRAGITKANSPGVNKSTATLIRDKRSGLMIDYSADWKPVPAETRAKIRRETRGPTAAEIRADDVDAAVLSAVGLAATNGRPMTKARPFGGRGEAGRRTELLPKALRATPYPRLEEALEALARAGKIELRVVAGSIGKRGQRAQEWHLTTAPKPATPDES